MTTPSFDVLHLSYWAPDQPGSYNRSIDQFLRSASASGHAVLTAGPARALDAEIADRVLFTSGRSHSRTRTRLKRLASFSAVDRYTAHDDLDRSAYAAEAVQFVRHHEPAVVLVYDDVRLCLELAQRRGEGTALVLSQHGTDYGLPADIARALYDPARIDGVIVLSTAARDLIEGQTSARGLRVDLLPNAVDTERLRPSSPDERAAAQAELGVAGGLVLGFVGRLNPKKGVHSALEVFAAVRADIPEARLVVGGRGADDYVQQLEARAAEPDLAGAVTFTGLLDPDGVRRVFWASDLVVFPTLMLEGMPLVVLEAMACGRAVAGYTFPAARDIADDTGGLVTVEPEDVRGLAATVVGLLRDEPRRSALDARAREQAVARFSIDAWCVDLAAVLGSYRPAART